MSDAEPAERDPFREARREGDVMRCPFQGEDVPMLLRHGHVREAAKDWETYSSDAPFRVPIPSEEDVRSTRQLPIETDPPDHTEYRAIVEPFFQRAKQPEVVERVESLVDGMIDALLERDAVEAVQEFAIPIQSRALTYLLDVPESEAETWIGWGIHVFKVGDGGKKGDALEDYLRTQLDRAEADPGDDFFSALTRATFRGRPLTREEMMGFGNLTFAGGRDTIIHSITSILVHFAERPEDLEFLRDQPKRIVLASEEFFRVFMPLTHIGRVCPRDTDVHGGKVEAGGRVSLCWNSANHDETVFDHPEEVRLDRKPNPHLSFGFGAHLCLGAPHARLVIRTLLTALANRVESIEVLDAEPLIEDEARYRRANGYESLRLRVEGR